LRIYLFLTFLFLTNRVLEARAWSAGPLRSWLDDVLVLPLALGFALWLQRRRGRPPGWTLPGAQVVLAVVLYAVVFEIVLPAFTERATADPWDAPAFAAGGVLFHVLLNRPAAMRSPEEPS
jgi:hypothetical protein